MQKQSRDFKSRESSKDSLTPAPAPFFWRGPRRRPLPHRRWPKATGLTAGGGSIQDKLLPRDEPVNAAIWGGFCGLPAHSLCGGETSCFDSRQMPSKPGWKNMT